MAHRDDRKRQIAHQLGVSVTVLEQYLQHKRAEVDAAPADAEARRPRSKPASRKGAPLQL